MHLRQSVRRSRTTLAKENEMSEETAKKEQQVESAKVE
jgi:hypothetical protein